jgi:hypothetical protein
VSIPEHCIGFSTCSDTSGILLEIPVKAHCLMKLFKTQGPTHGRCDSLCPRALPNLKLSNHYLFTYFPCHSNTAIYKRRASLSMQLIECVSTVQCMYCVCNEMCMLLEKRVPRLSS